MQFVLEQRTDDYIAAYAAEHENCPPCALRMVLEKGEYNKESSLSAVENPNCPPEALAEVLKRDKDDWVSRFAAQNPNCPTEALA